MYICPLYIDVRYQQSSQRAKSVEREECRQISSGWHEVQGGPSKKRTGYNGLR